VARSNQTNKFPLAITRNAAIIAFALTSLLSIWIAGSAGIASVLSGYAIAKNQMTSADVAVKLNRNNPEVRLTHAALLEANGDQPAAVAEYEEATALRPDDFVLWLALARANEISGDSERAIAAARKAVNLAPYYAEPHWQLGNILIRAGRSEGFRELSAAANSNPALMPGIIDLAWHLLNGNAKAIEDAIQPQSPESYRALARYFRQQNQVDEAITMYEGAGADARADIQAYIGELVSKKKYDEAFSLWGLIHDAGARESITDAGFEREGDLTEPGFGWRSTDPPSPNCHFVLDPANPREEKLSLRVDFTGDSDPATPVISQLILVQPLTHYSLQFSMRSENLVSAGLPVVVVIDANTGIVLAKSDQFARTAPEWHDYVVEFTSGSSTTIQVGLQREGCTSPCPIFGRVWLDAFRLREL
jgi:tetratricopeptide (TPR) repeat protein